MSGFVLGDKIFEAFKPFYAYDNKKLAFSGTTPKKNNHF